MECVNLKQFSFLFHDLTQNILCPGTFMHTLEFRACIYSQKASAEETQNIS